MINIIWFSLIAISLIYSFFSGNMATINDEVILSANKSIDLIMEMGPLIILWTGILKIAENSGLLEKIAKVLFI